MSNLNNINFLEYINDSDSDSEVQILETYSNGNMSDLSYESCEKNYSNDSYNKCIINLNENSDDEVIKYKSIYSNDCCENLNKITNNSSDNCKNDLNKNSPSDDYCKNDLSKNPISIIDKNKNSIESEINNSYSFNDCMSFNSHISNKKVNYVNVKNNNIEIRQIYLQKKIEQLEMLGNSFKKIGHSIEYYKYNLENSKDIILRETDEEASILLNHTSLNLYNIILLEVKKNLNSSKLRFITFENVKLYEVPKIDLQFDEGIIKFSIIDNKKIYNFKIGCKYIDSDDFEESIDDVVQESNYVYNYFNSRFNKISSIINYIKINSL